MHDEPKGADGSAQGGNQANTGIAPEDPLSTIPLSADHDVSGFLCTRSNNVKEFLTKTATNWVLARCSRVFIFPNPDNPKQIWGYYSLSASVIAPAALGPGHAGKLPRILTPMALLGYMGRHDEAPKGLGAGLVHDAALRVSRAGEHLGIWGIWLNAETEGLIKWYERLGFARAIPKNPADPPSKQMYAPLEALLPE